MFPLSNRRRRSLRLKGWDYRTPAYYFVTICTRERQCIFCDPILFDIVSLTWRLIPTQAHAHDWLLDEWVIMPNHLHGILLKPTPHEHNPNGDFTETIVPGMPFDMRYVTSREYGLELPSEKGKLLPGSLGVVVGSFKSAATRRINAQRRTVGASVWQRGYYEHIVRNSGELERIRRYIRENPDRWEGDRENLDALLEQMTYHDEA